MEIRRAHARDTGQVVSDWILAQSREVAQVQFLDRAPVQAVLLQSFAWVEEQWMETLKKVAEQVPEMIAQHVPEGQVGVFLAALYQLICTQQQGITSMVVTQAGVPIHLGVNNRAATASMTWLFAQVIPGLGSLHGCMLMPEQNEYTPIPPEGSTMIPTSLFWKPVRKEGTAAHPIYLGNDTDSGISSISRFTPVKTPGKGSNGQCQPLSSTPNSKPKLLVVAQQHQSELAAKQQGAPYGAHIWSMVWQVASTRLPGSELYSWKQAVDPGFTGNSSFISVEEHTQFTTAALIKRDAPSRTDLDEDVVSVRHSQSDI